MILGDIRFSCFFQALITLKPLEVLKYCYYHFLKLLESSTHTIFDALTNETKLSLVAVIVCEILAFSVFYVFQRFKNLKIAITSEMLITQYLMFHQFLYTF